MHLTQILTFELSQECNLGEKHTRCPNRHPDRYSHLPRPARLDDDAIFYVALEMHRRYGFRGLVAWHYYNEPLCEKERMFGLMRQLQAIVPSMRFLLWTNGTLLPLNQQDLDRFEWIVLTDYGQCPSYVIESVIQSHPRVVIGRWPLDGRLDVRGPERLQPCARMFTEFIIDNWGNVHLCCYDWRGLGSPGNVYVDALGTLVKRWQKIRKSMSGACMTSESPEVCRTCRVRNPDVPALLRPKVFTPDVVFDAESYVSDQRMRTRARKVGVVFVHYAIPEKRLAEHFEWNDTLYRVGQATVYVVADRPYDVPEYAHCVIVPIEELPELGGKPCFSLSLTKNRGIEAALADGCTTVIVTDTDIAFSGSAWWQMVEAGPTEVVTPVYRMARTNEERDPTNRPDYGMTGTLAMTAENWRRVRFNESCVGYGAEDGVILDVIKQYSLSQLRDRHVWHIAHDPEKHLLRVPGHGSADCWNRETLNPDNFEANRRAQ